MNSKWILLSLFFLSIAAIAGTMMRLSIFTDVFIPYNNLLHAHSHIAFQGWIYLTLFLLITKTYLPQDLYNSNRYRWQLYFTVFVLFGILISFAAQGYGLVSIIFSSLFQLLNYVFAWTFLKDTRKTPTGKKKSISLKFIQASIILMCVSTLGPWAVAVFSANGMAQTEYFDASLYFFFHFQYNGWFSFAVIGLLFYLAETKGYSFNKSHANKSFILFSWTIVPGYLLSLLGMSFGHYLYLPSLIIAIGQCLGLYYFIKSWKSSGIDKATWKNLLLFIFVCCLIIKFILQLSSAIPQLQEFAFHNRFVIIAYIHLTLIGFLTFALLFILNKLGWIMKSRIGQLFFITGFITTEITLLFLTFSPQLSQYQLMVFFSTLMVIGSLWILIRQFFFQPHPKRA
ncbi:MAG: hypothetical protein HUJ25_09370 [Crocinitomicaceae bacterium]|nr:hypothetical protein [Crocinitomicaceae bacterium]